MITAVKAVRAVGVRCTLHVARCTALPGVRRSAVLALTALTALPAAAQAPAYLFYVASESADEVTLLRFAPGTGLSVEKVIPVGFYPAEMEGPHGINLGPSGEHWYLTLGHGFPFGSLLKYRTGVDTLEGVVELGLFPATLTVSPLGGFVFAVNANFHGEHVPSTVSVVDAATMTEIERIPTCTMPHGSRLTSDGAFQFHTCMMDDVLVEIDVTALEPSRALGVGPAAREHRDHRTVPDERCSPTWAAPTPDDRRVFVMCNRTDEIVEVDRERWEVTRRWAAPRGPYNAEVTPDGRRLVVTQKGSGEVTIWDTQSARRVALLPSVRKVTHGVTIPPDGHYAFISVEGIGGEPGAVEVIDLRSLEKVAAADVGKQAGGIIFWRMGR